MRSIEEEICRDRVELERATTMTARLLDYLESVELEGEISPDSYFLEDIYTSSSPLSPGKLKEVTAYSVERHPDIMTEEESLDQIPISDIEEIAARELERLRNTKNRWQDYKDTTTPNADENDLRYVNFTLSQGEDLGFRPQTGVDRANMEWGLT